MSDFFKRFKSVFVTEEEGSQNASGSGSTKTPPNNESSSAGNKVVNSGSTGCSPVRPATSTVGGGIDTAIAETIATAIETQNIQGFDYLEFKESIKALSKLPMDEATMYRSAFATATTMGLTKDKLTQSLSFYLSIIDKQKTDFDEALVIQRRDNLERKELEISGIDKAIMEKSEQIRLLTDEIQKMQEQQDKARAELNTIAEKIEHTRMNFDATILSFKDQFTADLQKINDYIRQ